MTKGPKPMPPYDRVMRRVVVPADPDACWVWPGAVDGGGYGQVQVRAGASTNGKNLKVHRVVYEHDVGPIAATDDLHHTCRTRRCVNPAHLEPVSHVEHSRDHHASPTCTRCNANDWYERPDGGRSCRPCSARQRRERKSAAKGA